tara:strand:- start:10202 stop:10414 length:213 start_codon:yes stop_codon:yes gene_type:complete
MAWTAAALAFFAVCAALVLCVLLVRHLERTRAGVDEDFSIFRPYAKAPESDADERANVAKRIALNAKRGT